ncbi:hypothetical protein HZS_6247 [Henneguya salminicola]|nr:hypothetical protein HZS_6247 [Henneguya salminicola]
MNQHLPDLQSNECMIIRQKPFVTGHACRPSKSECDIPEFCTDALLSCDLDRFKINYTPCNRNRVYIFPIISRGIVIMGIVLYGSAQLPIYMKSVCAANMTLCNYFVCGVPMNYRSGSVQSFVRNGTKCIYPQINMRKGLLANAPFLMPCFIKSSSRPMSCINKKCHNSDIFETMPLNLKSAITWNIQTRAYKSENKPISAKQYLENNKNINKTEANG